MPKSMHTDAHASFAAALIALRKEQGVSQVELGERLSKQQSWISQVERGARRLDVVEFYAWSSALGVRPEDAFAQLVKALPEHVEI